MKPPNFALIGVAGYIAPRHLSAIQAVGGRLVAAADPQLSPAFHDSFLAAMSTACVSVGLLCLAGALAAAVLLPGRLPEQVVFTDLEVAEAEPADSAVAVLAA